MCYRKNETQRVIKDEEVKKPVDKKKIQNDILSLHGAGFKKFISK